jgi:hypothetical protein
VTGVQTCALPIWEEGDTFPGFEDVSSVYTNHKYDSPVATWAHTPGEKITILYDAFQHPSIMAEKYYKKLKKYGYNEIWAISVNYNGCYIN